jgi:WD40 repeat protein
VGGQEHDVPSSSSTTGTPTTPIGGIQLGCTFTKGDIPVSIGYNGKISILPVPSGILNSGAGHVSTIKILAGHQSPISSLAVDHDNGVMYTGDSDGCICKWDVHSNSAITNVQRGTDASDDVDTFDSTLMSKVHSGAISSLICGNDGTLLSIGWDDKIRFSYDSILTKSTQLDAQPNSIAKGNSLIAVLTVKGILLLHDNDITSDLIPIDYEALSICVSSNDQTIYVGGQDYNIHIYQVSDNTLTKKEILSGDHLKPIYSLALSNDGTKLASGDAQSVCVWDVSENHAPIVGRSRWCFHQQRINALAWSNDDSIIASGGNDDSIYLWSLKKKAKRVHYSFAHRGGISSMVFLKNTNGTVLVSAGNDGCVNQWDVTSDIMDKFG